MMDKLKDFIFHVAVKRGTIAAAAATVAVLSKPAVIAGLAAAGITVDPVKLSAAVIVALTWLVGTGAHYLEHKQPDPNGSAKPN
jgi:hypothetical protein